MNSCVLRDFISRNIIDTVTIGTWEFQTSFTHFIVCDGIENIVIPMLS